MIRQEGKTAALKWFGTAGLDALIETVAKDAGVRVRLVVLDPAGDFLDGSEDDAAVVKPLMRRLREIAGAMDARSYWLATRRKARLTATMLVSAACAAPAPGPTTRASVLVCGARTMKARQAS